MMHVVTESEGAIRALESDALGEGAMAAVDLGGWPVLLVRVDGVARATINRCTHAAAAFAPGGRMRRGVLMCPAHGARFRVDDGQCIGGTYRALRTFPCREVDGWIEVDVPETPPGPDEMAVAR